jgi:hypothetical protein
MEIKRLRENFTRLLPYEILNPFNECSIQNYKII